MYTNAIKNGKHFIFINEENDVYGGCSFEHMKLKDDELWILDWIWIDPNFRQQGKLQQYWNELQPSTGRLAYKLPISEAMQKFLIKNNLDDSSGRMTGKFGTYIPFYKGK